MTQGSNGDQTIGEIALQGSSKLIFSVSEWRGKHFANVRKFVATQKYQGPTKSGLSMDKKFLLEIISALTQLEKTLPPQEEKEFKRIFKNETDHIKITTLPTTDEDNLPSVDVREYVELPTYQGPTKKGFRIRWNHLPDVIACLREQSKIISEAKKIQPTLFDMGAFGGESENASIPASEVQCTSSIEELLGGVIKQFPDDFLDGAIEKGVQMDLPEDLLKLEQDNNGTWLLKTDEGEFSRVRNSVEGNFILYSQLRGMPNVIVPKEMICIFKIVKSYENYARATQNKIVAKLLKKTHQRSLAEYEARK